MINLLHNIYLLQHFIRNKDHSVALIVAGAIVLGCAACTSQASIQLCWPVYNDTIFFKWV